MSPTIVRMLEFCGQAAKAARNDLRDAMGQPGQGTAALKRVHATLDVLQELSELSRAMDCGDAPRLHAACQSASEATQRAMRICKDSPACMDALHMGFITLRQIHRCADPDQPRQENDQR